MKLTLDKILVIVLVVVIAGAIAAQQVVSYKAEQERQFRQSQLQSKLQWLNSPETKGHSVLVRFKDDATEADRISVLQSIDGAEVINLQYKNSYVVKADLFTVEQLTAYFKEELSVLSARGGPVMSID